MKSERSRSSSRAPKHPFHRHPPRQRRLRRLQPTNPLHRRWKLKLKWRNPTTCSSSRNRRPPASGHLRPSTAGSGCPTGRSTPMSPQSKEGTPTRTCITRFTVGPGWLRPGSGAGAPFRSMGISDLGASPGTEARHSDTRAGAKAFIEAGPIRGTASTGAATVIGRVTAVALAVVTGAASTPAPASTAAVVIEEAVATGGMLAVATGAASTPAPASPAAVVTEEAVATTAAWAAPHEVALAAALMVEASGAAAAGEAPLRPVLLISTETLAEVGEGRFQMGGRLGCYSRRTDREDRRVVPRKSSNQT